MYFTFPSLNSFDYFCSGEKNFKEAKTPPPKSLRSSKKVKTPVVTVQAPKKTPDSKSERISSGSNIKEGKI